MLTFSVFNPNLHQQQTLDRASLRIIGVQSGDSCCQVDFSSEKATVRVPLRQDKSLDLSIDRLESEDGSRIKMVNRGRSVALSSGPRIHRGRSVVLDLPINFCVGDNHFQIIDHHQAHPIDAGLTTLSNSMLSENSTSRVSPGPETLAAWLETLSDLQRIAAGTKPLFDLVAQSVFNPGGLDGCLLLQQCDAGWSIVASYLPYPDHGIGFREDLVQAVSKSKQTVYHDASVIDGLDALEDLHTAVVCPIVDDHSEVKAVIYGFRSLHRRNLRKGIRPLEAQFVQVIADSLSAGIVRLESEAEAARSQVLLEHAFTPKIVKQLQAGKEVLQPRTQEVTVLFADLRGFSAIAESQDTNTTFELLSDVMDEFSGAISDLDGVVIDFYGDGIAAFWNAPVAQPEHAVLACQAAMEMLACLPKLNRVWEARIGGEIRAGIGIHTGMASVGNSGSRSRLKYGPRGTTVNLASRLEGLTKEVGFPLLVSGATAVRIEGVFAAERVGDYQLAGHEQSTEVFRVVGDRKSRSAVKEQSVGKRTLEATK